MKEMKNRAVSEMKILITLLSASEMLDLTTVMLFSFLAVSDAFVDFEN